MLVYQRVDKEVEKTRFPPETPTVAIIKKPVMAWSRSGLLIVTSPNSHHYVEVNVNSHHSPDSVIN